MIQLNSGNVLLKPSHRRQMMTWLKRALRLGQQMGNFFIQITMKRVGRMHEVIVSVRDTAGDFRMRMKRHDWRDAVRDLARMISVRLHDQKLSLN